MKNRCWMIKGQPSWISMRRTAAIGDAICATVVADKLSARGFAVMYQAHPHIRGVIDRAPSVAQTSDPQGQVIVNLDGAYERHPQKKHIHFHAAFVAAANMQLRQSGIDLGPPVNCRPKLTMLPHEKAAWRTHLAAHPRPWVAIVPRSNSYTTRQIADGVWTEIAKRIQGTCFWTGTHPGPPGIVDLGCRSFDPVMGAVGIADLVVSVDTGPLHVALAFGTPAIAIYQSSNPELHFNDQNDFTSIHANLDCLGCMENVCPKNSWQPPCQTIDPDFVAGLANTRLSLQANPRSVSVVIPTFKATAERLQSCIQAVLPQVDEIVVTRAADAVMPPRLVDHPKVRYVLKPVSKLGFGKNINFGARHTRGRWLLLLNDDVVLQPDAVAKLLDCTAPNVGMVSHLLRYPSGMIQYGGKYRGNGDRGWGHIDHRKWDHAIKGPVEQEVACGASVLVNREAFYKVGGFDERFHMYSEDDDLSMRIRQARYRIIYTPHALGTHDESATAKMTGMQMEWIRASNALMDSLWGWYFNANRDNSLGSFL